MNKNGFTLIELLITTAISALLVLAIGGVAGRAITAWQYGDERQDLLYQGEFAMNQIISSLREGQLLITPPDLTPSSVLEVVLDPAVDPVSDPLRYEIVGQTLQETRHGTARVIAEVPQINFQVQRLTPPGDNSTQIDVTITLTGNYSEPLVLNSQVLLGMGS